MKKIVFVLSLLVISLVLFGCTQPDPIATASKTASAKAFIAEYNAVKIKSVFFESLSKDSLSTEIKEKCGGVTPFDEGYRVSYANSDLNTAINVWVSKDAKKVLCIYAQNLTNDKKIVCQSGVYNKLTKQCEITPDSNYFCAVGTYDSNSNMCIRSPQLQIICSQGVYNSSTQVCEYVPPITNICSQGTYDPTTQTCTYNPNLIPQTCSIQSGNVCTTNQTCSTSWLSATDSNYCCSGNCVSEVTPQPNICGNGKCDLEETAANCSTDCYSDNLPYSVLAIHEETWGGMVKMVELANQYHTPLSIFFWPGVVDYILEDQNRINLVHSWQAQGHEIGIHNQECDNTGTNDKAFFGPDDAVKYEQLAAPYKVQSGTSGCTTWLPADYKYNIGITRVEGRTSRALKQMYPNSKQILSIAGKPNYFGDYAGCGGVQLKIDQYMTLNPTEIYGYIVHTLEVEGCDGVPDSLGAAECPGVIAGYGGSSEVPFETWLKFLYEKDPTGKKRLTLSKLMETYIIPNNLIADANTVCNSTNPLVQQCWPVGKSAKSNSSNCVFGTDTDVFNYGRCLDTQKYCDFNSQWYDTLGRYCPQSCVLKNISDYNSAVVVPPTNFCGDLVCNGNETSKSCPVDCSTTGGKQTCSQLSGTICSAGQTCSTKLQTASDTPSCCVGTCASGSASCGDHICDGAAGEKISCPQDCVAPVK